jgi:hypothetical protein
MAGPVEQPARQDIATLAASFERVALLAVERAARAYAKFTHGNLNGAAYRAREEARDELLDALATLDAARARGGAS